MLHHPILERLHELGLEGMVKGFRDLAANTESRGLDHAEWLGLLLEQEVTLRRQKRFEARTRTAKLRQAASMEDVNYKAARGLDRTLFLRLASCDWIREHRHCLITGPCGVGKSWLACALGDKACRENLSVLYQRSSRLFAALALARGDGRYARLMRQLTRVDLLILDDLSYVRRDQAETSVLFELVMHRYERKSLRRSADPGRLGARTADRRATPRPAGDRRRPLRSWLADHHQPGADRTLVRDRGRSHAGRRHPRPPRPQRLPHRTERRKLAQAACCRLTPGTLP